jgi:hypothetical protein
VRVKDATRRAFEFIVGRKFAAKLASPVTAVCGLLRRLERPAVVSEVLVAAPTHAVEHCSDGG